MLKFGLGVFNQGSNTKFNVGATFEMRTVNDNARQGLYTESNGGESKIAERERERERERGRASLKMRDGVDNKFDHWRKYLWQIWEGNLKQSRCRQ